MTSSAFQSGFRNGGACWTRLWFLLYLDRNHSPSSGDVRNGFNVCTVKKSGHEQLLTFPKDTPLWWSIQLVLSYTNINKHKVLNDRAG